MYEILEPDNNNQKWYVIPKYGSGQCYEATSKEHAEQILQFIKNKDPVYIENIERL